MDTNKMMKDERSRIAALVVNCSLIFEGDTIVEEDCRMTSI
jgi:hypothetical protein